MTRPKILEILIKMEIGQTTIIPRVQESAYRSAAKRNGLKLKRHLLPDGNIEIKRIQ